MFGNTVTIIGNLTRDPELRYTQNGNALTKMGVAWNYRTQNGTENVSFFDITCWGELGENVANSNLVKGSRVVVVGRLDQSNYETREGQKRSSVQIIADEVSPSLRWAKVEVTKNSGGSNDGGSQAAPATESDSQVANADLVDSSVSSGTESDSNNNEEEPF